MSKPLAVVLSLVLALAACTAAPGTDETRPDTTTPGQPTTTVTPPTDDGGSPTTTSGSSEPPTTSDRPLAQDFTMELGDGGTYTLSEGAKPVYLVFWAEW